MLEELVGVVPFEAGWADEKSVVLDAASGVMVSDVSVDVVKVEIDSSEVVAAT